MKPEYHLAKQIAQYLTALPSKPIFHMDLSGINLGVVRGSLMKAIQGDSGFPDLFIAEPRGQYHGLFIELKAKNIYKKDGTLLSNEHNHKQSLFLSKLQSKGYYACFGLKYESTKKIIDEYLAIKTDFEINALNK